MPANRYFLRGIDYFQLLIDHHGKVKGGRGHEAHLSVLLQGHIDQSTVQNLINENPIAKQLMQIRVSKTFGLGYPSIYYTKSHTFTPLRFINIDDDKVPSENYNFSINPYKEPPFYLQVLYLNNNTTTLVFTFHHILFDFSGVQAFIFSLAGMSDPVLFNIKQISRAFKTRFKGFFREVVFTFKEANTAMTIPAAKLPVKKPLEIEYKEIIFSDEDSKLIAANASTAGVALNNSLFLLASCCQALHRNIFKSQKSHDFIWVPVPVNKRRKGGNNSVLFNELTFLFFKIKSTELCDKNKIINSLKNQMTDQIRNDMPESFIDFVEGYKYMPMPIYYPMLLLPSWGKLSSFSFSALGNTFQGLNSFFGHQIIDIKNFPSNSISPGITFLFYKYNNEMRLMSSWVKGQYSIDVQNKVLKDIQTFLIGQRS